MSIGLSVLLAERMRVVEMVCCCLTEVIALVEELTVTVTGTNIKLSTSSFSVARSCCASISERLYV